MIKNYIINKSKRVTNVMKLNDCKDYSPLDNSGLSPGGIQSSMLSF